MRKLKMMLATILALVVMAAMSVPAMATGNGNGHYCKHHCGSDQPDNTNTNGQGQVQYQFVIINKKGHKHHKRGGHGGKHHR